MRPLPLLLSRCLTGAASTASALRLCVPRPRASRRTRLSPLMGRTCGMLSVSYTHLRAHETGAYL
eukprot:1656592-Pyramimonas_sp.AAC.1